MPLENDNIIPLDEAIRRIQEYRRKAADIMPAEAVTKAIFIPIADIMEIIERFKFSPEANEQDISGIRVYFNLMPDIPEDIYIHGLVVPVREDGTDIVIDPEEGESSIYDFTKPCPPVCDVNSPLYLAE